MNIHKYKLTIFININNTSGKEKLFEPKNFNTKYSKIGIPKPKLYTMTTPYLTSSNLKIYQSLSQLLKYLERLPVELNKKIIVVRTQKGP